jgi:hypothetical protein
LGGCQEASVASSRSGSLPSARLRRPLDSALVMASRRLTPTQKPASHRHTRWTREEATGTPFVTEITINCLDQGPVNYRDHSQRDQSTTIRIETTGLPHAESSLALLTRPIHDNKD